MDQLQRGKHNERETKIYSATLFQPYQKGSISHAATQNTPKYVKSSGKN